MRSLFKNVKRNLGRIYQHFHKYHWHFALVFLLSLLYSLLSGFGLSAFIPVFKLVETRDPQEFSRIGKAFHTVFQLIGVKPTLDSLFLLMIVLLILRWIVFAASQFLIQYLIAEYKRNTIDTLSDKLFRSDWEYFQNQNKGSLLDYMTTRIVRVRRVFSIFSKLLVNYTVALGYLLVAFWISFPLTIGALILSVVTVGVMIPLAGKTKNISERSVDSQNQISRLISEYMNLFREIKIFQIFERVHERIKEQTSRNARAELKVGLMRVLSRETFQIIVAIAILGAIYFALGVMNIDFARMSVVAFLFLIMFQRLTKFQYTQRLAEFLPSIDVLERFSDQLETNFEKRKVTKHKESKRLENGFGCDILFRNVWFRYRSQTEANDEFALKNIHLTISQGSMVSFVGKSGAGKSTLVGILLGLLEPDQGQVEVDGISLQEMGLENWRKETAYVPQEPYLLNETIEENIRLFRDINRERLVEAAQKSHSYEFIQDTPDGFDTVIGEEGVKLSGGQRQRLVFARAIAGNPDVLILDEVTSELDSISESRIHQSLISLQKNTTIISVSHQLSHLIDSDVIFVLKNGTVEEQGTIEELEEKEGHFSELHRSTHQKDH